MDVKARRETDLERPPLVVRLLADDLRWRVVQALRSGDRSVSELRQLLGASQNLVSYHLGLLRDGGLVRAHRSDADARSTYYQLNLPVLIHGLGELGHSVRFGALERPRGTDPLQIAFVCTHNQARSQMAEGWLRQLGGGEFIVRSAGVDPRPIHPLAIAVMAERGVDIASQESKDLSALDGAPLDLLITVCDRAKEACGPILSSGLQIHWSVPSPVEAVGTDRGRLDAFRATRDELRWRTEGLLTMLRKPERRP